MKTLANPQLTIDGNDRLLAMQFQTEAGRHLDVEIPLTDVGTVVQFLAKYADHLAREAEEDGVDITTHQKAFAPIPLRGLAFATGLTPSETLLVVRLAGFDLAFSVSSSELSALSRDLARIAQTLSAEVSKPQ